MRRILRLLLPLLALLLINSCGSKKDDVIAVVDGEEISAQLITDFFEMRGAEFPSWEIEVKAMREALDSLIDYKLLIIGAYTAGLGTDQEIVKIVNSEKSRFMFDELYRQVILPKTEVSERDIEELFEKLQTEYHFAHILVDSEDEADSLYEEIREGADFAMIARTSSNDQSSAVSGGDVGFVTWASPLNEQFRDAAFSLAVDELSRPVKSSLGWHIIKLLETRPGNTGSLEQLRPVLRDRLRAEKSTRAELAFLEGVRKRANIQIRKDATDLLIERLDKFYPPNMSGQDRPDNWFPNLDLLEPYEKDMIFATYMGGELTIEGYISKIADVQPFYRPKFSDHDSLKTVIFQLELRNIVEFEAHEHNIEEEEGFIKRMTDFKEGVMVDKFQRSVIGANLTVSEDEAIDYYNSHLEEFHMPQQFRILEIEQSTREEVEDVLKSLKAGAHFGSLALERTTRPNMQAVGGDLGSIEEYRYPKLFEAAKKLKMGELSDVVVNARGYFSVIKLLESRAAMTKSLEDAFVEVKRRVLHGKRATAAIDWLVSERQKHDIQIFEDAIENTVDRSKYEEN